MRSALRASSGSGLLIAFVTVAAMVLAACGGGEGDTAGTSPTDDSTVDAGEEQASTVPIAVILPLSGPYGRSGELYRAGMEMAVDEINEGGGIEAHRGAELKLDIHDAGESAESAVAAAREALTGDEKPAAGIGSWLSSFTLGITEVAEREGVPWLTISSSDQITDRGLTHVYQTVPPSSTWAVDGLAWLQSVSEEEGCPIESVGIVGDNTAAPSAFYDAVRDNVAPDLGWEITVEEVWTPPLSDATSIGQNLRDRSPDLVLFGATNFSDAAQVLSSAAEFGVETNYIGNGSWLVMPEYLDAVGADKLEGILSISGLHPLDGQEELVERFSERTGEPFLQQEGMAGYANVWLIKEALESASSANPEDVQEAMRSLDLTSGPAVDAMPVDRVSFDEAGQLEDAVPVVSQWQDGLPVSVYPTDAAMASANFKCGDT